MICGVTKCDGECGECGGGLVSCGGVDGERVRPDGVNDKWVICWEDGEPVTPGGADGKRDRSGEDRGISVTIICVYTNYAYVHVSNLGQNTPLVSSCYTTSLTHIHC